MADAQSDSLESVRVASGISTLIGMWLVVSPWFWLEGTASGNTWSLWNNLLLGTTVALLGMIRFNTPERLAVLSYITAALGVWFTLSPWIYGYAGNDGRLWNGLVSGFAILALALFSGRLTAARRRRAHG